MTHKYEMYGILENGITHKSIHVSLLFSTLNIRCMMHVCRGNILAIEDMGLKNSRGELAISYEILLSIWTAVKNFKGLHICSCM